MRIPDESEVFAALKESESRMRAILDSSADAIVTIDLSGKIIDVNPATVRMFGYREDEVMGQDVSIFMPSPHREHHHHYLARYLETGEERVIGIGRELRGRRKDGSTFPVELVVNPIDHLGMFCGIMRDVSERHALESQVIHAVMDERRRSARELHDGLGSLLTAIHLRLNTLAKSLSQSGGDMGQEAASIVELVKKALRETRAIAKGLDPVGQEPEDLMTSLGELASQVRLASSMDCEYHCLEPVFILDPFMSRHLYRIAQEATNNAVKHSGASRIVIELARNDESVFLSVSDNGKGLLSPYQPGEGSGLQIMRYRANAIGGTLSFAPPQEGGNRVICAVTMARCGDDPGVRPTL